MPYLFPTAGDDRRACRPDPRGRDARRAGQFGYDTMTLVGPGTWEAARAAVDCALTAADLVAGGRAGGVRALPPARPPRDAGRASAAPATSTTPPSPPRRCATPGTTGSAVVDVDAHHGNGTAGDLLRPRRRALRLGARRPGRRLVPARRRLRRRDRRRRGRRARPATSRCPRAPATSRGSRPSRELAEWVAARAAPRWSSRSASTPPRTTRRARCRSPPTATARPARLLGALGLPAVVVQEGGYHLATLGGLVAAYLDGHARRRDGSGPSARVRDADAMRAWFLRRSLLVAAASALAPRSRRHGDPGRDAVPPTPAGRAATSTADAATPITVGDLTLQPCGVVARACCGHLDRPGSRATRRPGTVRVGFAFVPARDDSRPALGTFVPHEGGPGYCDDRHRRVVRRRCTAPLLRPPQPAARRPARHRPVRADRLPRPAEPEDRLLRRRAAAAAAASAPGATTTRPPGPPTTSRR